MQIWAESGKSALPICNYSQILYQFLTFTQNLKRSLKKEGITEIHYIGNLEKKLDFIPGYAAAPWMISGMGILYGRK